MRLSSNSQPDVLACLWKTRALKRWPAIVPITQVPSPAAWRVVLVISSDWPRIEFVCFWSSFVIVFPLVVMVCVSRITDSYLVYARTSSRVLLRFLRVPGSPLLKDGGRRSRPQKGAFSGKGPGWPTEAVSHAATGERGRAERRAGRVPTPGQTKPPVERP